MPGYPTIVFVHVALGSIALVAFWSAALMRKGSPRHRAIGRLFLWAMAGVIASGVPMVIEFAAFRHKPGIALFLAYLIAITANACWLAWRAVTDKRDWQAMTRRTGWHLNMGLPLLLGFAVVAMGIATGQALFIGFGLLGPWLGYSMLRFARRGPRVANWHVVQHYQSMLGAGVATHVAFLSIGLRPAWRWLQAHAMVPDALVNLFPWFAPLAVALAAGFWLDRRYARPLRRVVMP